jgi:hypothetical protein
MGRVTILRLSVLLAAPLLVLEAHADSVCEKGHRDTTEAEQRTMTGVMEAAKAALPLAPEGWVIGGYEELSPIASICMDGESVPWGYRFSRTFNRTDDAAAREQALADVGARLRARQEELRPRQEALMAKMSALGGELGTAVQRGDQARVAALQVEIEKVTAEFEALAEEADDPAAIEAVARASAEDVTMSIAVDFNAITFVPAAEQRAAPPAGAHSAYRWTTEDTGVGTAHAVFLFGAWQPRAEGGVSATRRGNASSAAAHNFIVTVEADPGRIDSLLGSIDFSALAATLAR